jgi:cytochrome c oxidase subunit II
MKGAGGRRLAALGTGAVLLLASCAEDAPQDALDPAGPVARKIDGLWDLVFAMAVVVFVIVEGVLVLAVLRFRHRRDEERRVKQVHGNTRLEVIWTIVPALMLAAVAVPTVGTIWDLSRRPVGNVLNVSVTGKQWWWDIEYPDMDPPVRTANELHIPAGRPVYITLTSEDVIHSFGVQRLAGTQDLIPGHETTLTIQADEPGTYLGQCREYCGDSHGNMRIRVIAHDAAGFAEWVAAQQQAGLTPSDGLARQGAELFLRPDLCILCHAIQGIEEARSTEGPDLTHFGSRETIGTVLENTPENLMTWLENPGAVKEDSRMPDYGCPVETEEGPRDCLSEEEVEALVAYLTSLE